MCDKMDLGSNGDCSNIEKGKNNMTDINRVETKIASCCAFHDGCNNVMNDNEVMDEKEENSKSSQGSKCEEEDSDGDMHLDKLFKGEYCGGRKS